ncbi:MAG: 16S rRNA (cytidine(1402)-2'-O)-methyltransferase [Acholeplasmatales bacterium]|nr:16S rRNA (cytidine(1402)-2'-O)-methyltransferase [Acholeplasmatales bacterium]
MRVRSFGHNNGILYLVATPIGNLSDITLRAIEVLKSVDKIYAEDTRNSITLLRHYNITTKLESYHEYNQDIKTDTIINELKEGLSIAIISDAGLPIISDPGYKIVKEASRLGLAVSTIPGASAGISALIASGLAPMPYTFYGFLDAKKTKRISELESLKYVSHTIIFYEAPHRIFECLSDMLEVLGDRNVCLARELTKTYEEYIRGNISDILKLDTIKGEIVLIVEGYNEDSSILEDINPNEKIDELISLGYKPNEAIKEVSKLLNLDRKELYKQYSDYKNNK